MINKTRSIKTIFDELVFFNYVIATSMYYELPSQHNCNLAVVGLALVAAT